MSKLEDSLMKDRMITMYEWKLMQQDHELDVYRHFLEELEAQVHILRMNFPAPYRELDKFTPGDDYFWFAVTVENGRRKAYGTFCDTWNTDETEEEFKARLAKWWHEQYPDNPHEPDILISERAKSILSYPVPVDLDQLIHSKEMQEQAELDREKANKRLWGKGDE